MYSQKDIYLLDDCLSAVDQRVAKHIFEKCILGYLKGKCVVMVTNHINFISYADNVVCTMIASRFHATNLVQVVIKDCTVAGQLSKKDMSCAQIEENLHNLGIDLTKKYVSPP